MSTHHLWPKIYPDRRAVWHRGCRPKNNDRVNQKILYAIDNVRSFPLERIIIQFWAPVKTSAGDLILSCSDCPYAASHVNHLLWKYRSGCVKYYYVVCDRSGLVNNDPMTITGAPPSTAVWNNFPEVVLDLRVHHGTPLVDLAIECELTCFMMVPVFQEAGCVGVIEVSMRHPAGLAVIFKELNLELKRVGLRISTPPEFLWAGHKVKEHKDITGDLRRAAREIERALQVAVQSHDITLGQAWYPYENFHYRGRLRRTLLYKLRSCSVGGDDPIKQFYANFRVLPLKRVEGLVGRTLQTHQPHMCKNLYKLSDNKGVLAVLSAANNITKCSCFVICLRSSHTGELDYAFEFFWPQSRNHLALMEDLLMTLREHLPSFKYASGAQLGDELLVVDVENSSSASGSTPIKIFPVNKRHKATMASVKSELNKYPLEDEDDDDDDDDDDLVILAVYKVYPRLFFLPKSPTFENVMDKIKREFGLNPAGASYKVEYQLVPGKWYSLTDDTCLKNCISSYRALKNNIDYIKFYVLAVEE